MKGSNTKASKLRAKSFHVVLTSEEAKGSRHCFGSSYGYFSQRLASVDLVRICHDCFRYMGGMLAELVFDQDSIVCVSENAGDIIYTYEFEKSQLAAMLNNGNLLEIFGSEIVGIPTETVLAITQAQVWGGGMML